MIDSMSLYRIGTGWVFDVNTNTGYRVERTGETRRGKIKSFTKAFELRILGGVVTPTYILEVPMGVVRKAVHLAELYAKGKLEQRNGRYH